MGYSTARRHLQRPEVLAEVRAARDAILDETVGKLAALVPKALAELEALLANTNGPVRLGASKAICEYALRFSESHALASRIAALEEQVTQEDEQARRTGT